MDPTRFLHLTFQENIALWRSEIAELDLYKHRHIQLGWKLMSYVTATISHDRIRLYMISLVRLPYYVGGKLKTTLVKYKQANDWKVYYDATSAIVSILLSNSFSALGFKVSLTLFCSHHNWPGGGTREATSLLLIKISLQKRFDFLEKQLYISWILLRKEVQIKCKFKGRRKSKCEGEWVGVRTLALWGQCHDNCGQTRQK